LQGATPLVNQQPHGFICPLSGAADPLQRGDGGWAMHGGATLPSAPSDPAIPFA